MGILVPGPGIEQASPELRSRFFITREFFITSLLAGLRGVFGGDSWSGFSAYTGLHVLLLHAVSFHLIFTTQSRSEKVLIS